ncbi:tetratricopeptide repeat protein [Thiobacillus sp.]
MAVKRGLCLIPLLVWAAAAQANPAWDGLWRTPDQRAQQLLRQGKAAEASRVFQDPRRKAYAELQAGNFTQAAQDFTAFDDGDGQYNRGNALARAGRLQEAIKAYDAALAHDPNNRDARHNRELVAKALQKQSSPPKSQSDPGKNQQGDKGQSGQNDQKQDDQGKQKQGGQKQGDQKQASGTQNGDASKPSPGKAAQADTPSRNPAGSAQTQAAGQGQPPQGQPQAGAVKPGQAPDHGNPAADGAQQKQTTNDAAQARNDAAAGLARPQTGHPPQAASTPPSERQLAESQWLRQIPDDPGGLLRRKFMIEHLIRQQGTHP